MKLPNLEQATIPPEKITRYLLDLSHEEGRGKARFFIHFGFSMAQWQQLASALLRHATAHPVVATEQTPFGTRYVVEGALETPSERTPQVRVVWFTSHNDLSPRLVTAYPLEEEDD